MPSYRNDSIALDIPANQPVNDREQGWCEIIKGYLTDCGLVVTDCFCPNRRCIIGLAFFIFCLLLFGSLAEMRASIAASRVEPPQEVTEFINTSTTDIPTTETALWTD